MYVDGVYGCDRRQQGGYCVMDSRVGGVSDVRCVGTWVGFDRHVSGGCCLVGQM